MKASQVTDLLEQIVEQTEKVLEAQERYFRTRSGLDTCKALEASLRKLIARYKAISIGNTSQPPQADMFGQAGS